VVVHHDESREMNTFKHSGARGDLIYSLPTVFALGGGTLHVNRKDNHYFVSPVGDEEMAGIREFLMTQPYIQEVDEWDGCHVNYDLDIFRLQDVRRNLLTVGHLNSFGREFDLRQPWIETTKIPVIQRAEIVISRSSKYHAFRFHWNELDPWIDRAVFAGTEEEHRKFQEETGLKVDWEMPKSWMELAGIIQGCKLFVGNQSFPYSLAEGMKVPRVLEECMYCPNCHPQSWNGHMKLHQSLIRKYLSGETYVDSLPALNREEMMRKGQRRW
jgi:hypothetical protein